MDSILYPIIYVRGYAMTQGEIDETTVDPFCGSISARRSIERRRIKSAAAQIYL